MNCPNKKCQRKISNPIVKYHNSGSDNIDNLAHSHLQCPFCGWQFNRWHCGIDRLKEVFGNQFHLYL
jgi:hypothetical protein